MLSELRERTSDGDRPAASRDRLLDSTRTSLLAREDRLPETG
jgi:hypothetical protein